MPSRRWRRALIRFAVVLAAGTAAVAGPLTAGSPAIRGGARSPTDGCTRRVALLLRRPSGPASRPQTGGPNAAAQWAYRRDVRPQRARSPLAEPRLPMRR